jgi:O-antigen ligase
LWGLTDSKLEIFARPASKLGTLLVFGLPLGLLLAALFATQSRSAWLGFGMAAVVVLVINSKKTAAMVASLVLVGAIIALIGAFDLGGSKINTTYSVVIQRLVEAGSIFTITDISSIEVNDANFATIERLAHWQAAREMWRDNPWLGTGFGNYAAVYPAYAVGRWLNPLGHAHNYVLNIGAEAGLLGVTVYLIFWIYSFGVLWRTVRRNHGFERAVAVGGLGIMVHLHGHNLFDNLYVQGMYLHIAIILALVSVIYQAGNLPERDFGSFRKHLR